MAIGHYQRQRGASLFIALIVLALLTILGSGTLGSSIVELRLSGHAQQSVDSLQQADAGIAATMALINGANDPFNGGSSADPFAGLSASENPLAPLPNVGASTLLVQNAGACGRMEAASSASQVACEYYEITSQHDAGAASAGSTLRQGVRRQVIAH